MKIDIRKSIKMQHDRVRRNADGTWDVLDYEHPNQASKGRWLFYAHDDADAQEQAARGY